MGKNSSVTRVSVQGTRGPRKLARNQCCFHALPECHSHTSCRLWHCKSDTKNQQQLNLPVYIHHFYSQRHPLCPVILCKVPYSVFYNVHRERTSVWICCGQDLDRHARILHCCHIQTETDCCFCTFIHRSKHLDSYRLLWSADAVPCTVMKSAKFQMSSPMTYCFLFWSKILW